MKTNLSCVTLVHNVTKIKYPWQYSILSALPICDRIVVVNSGPNDDDTTEQLCQLAYKNPKVIIVTDGTEARKLTLSEQKVTWHYHEGCTWPDHANKISTVWNVGYDFVETEWAMELQADEVLAEWDYQPLLAILESLPPFVQVGWVKFLHFCGDLRHQFPFIYQTLPKFCRTTSCIRTFGDAFALAVPANTVYTELPITYYHCGKVHTGREAEAAWKEYTWQRDLYAGKLFDQPDPLVKAAYDIGKMDFFKVFLDAAAKGQITEYNGPWPEMVKLWAKDVLGITL
jgi:hypothetical protein